VGERNTYEVVYLDRPRHHAVAGAAVEGDVVTGGDFVDVTVVTV
jgi:hypothetical protein